MARIAAFSCLHAPFTDPRAFEWLAGQLEAEATGAGLTHLVMLGDWLDTEPASPHPNEGEHDQADEYEVCAAQSERLRKIVGGGVKLVRHDGNHEDRLEPYRMNIPRRLRTLVHWTRHERIAREWHLWRWVPYEKSVRGCTQIGQVVLYHGFDTGTNSDELEGLQMAMACGGHAHRLLVRGHTHRPLEPFQFARTRRVPLPYWGLNVGHLGPRHPVWMRSKDVLSWGQGLAIIEATEGDPGRMRGKEWDAELRLFSRGP